MPPTPSCCRTRYGPIFCGIYDIDTWRLLRRTGGILRELCELHVPQPPAERLLRDLQTLHHGVQIAALLLEALLDLLGGEVRGFADVRALLDQGIEGGPRDPQCRGGGLEVPPVLAQSRQELLLAHLGRPAPPRRCRWRGLGGMPLPGSRGVLLPQQPFDLGADLQAGEAAAADDELARH